MTVDRTAPPFGGAAGRGQAPTVAVVTGASRGIGRAIATRLAEAGMDVALWARDAVELAEAARAIPRSRAYVVDVTDTAAVTRGAAQVRAELGPVGVLVNNAGNVLRKATAEITDAEWSRVMAVNLDGTFRVTRAFLPELIAAHGRIINLASRAGREGTPMLAAYCAAKHGVVGLTRALAEELRAAKVSVNAICPGSVDTAMLREGLPDASPDMTPDDIARTAVFLAAGAPAALTGTCIDVFG